MILRNYITTESRVVRTQPVFTSLVDAAAGRPAFTISICKDNSAFLLASEAEPSNGTKATLYPPPSAQLIKKIVYSIRLNRFLVLLTNSNICVYQRVKETALLERIQDSAEVRDSEFKRAFN